MIYLHKKRDMEYILHCVPKGVRVYYKFKVVYRSL